MLYASLSELRCFGTLLWLAVWLAGWLAGLARLAISD